jgi:hypothetical protein
MRNWMIVVLALVLSTSAWAGKPTNKDPLTDYERGMVISGAYIAYSFAVITFDSETMTTGLDPYLCWPFPVEWNSFYQRIRFLVVQRVSEMTQKERNALGDDFRLLIWDVITNEYGCWEHVNEERWR